MRPPAALLDRLMTSRLLPSRAQPTAGVGERRSRQKGAGMEFVDHRPYQAGDDTRHLDVHVMARTGDTVIRQYAQMRQLPVTVFVDLSASMGGAKAQKETAARLIAQVFGFVGLAAGDRVQVATCGAGGVAAQVSPRWQGSGRADDLFAWLARAPGGGAADVAGALRQLLGSLTARGLVIVISDWWDEALPDQLSLAEAQGQEVWAIQLLSEAERNPESLGSGVMTLGDAETGEEIDVRLDAGTLGRYAEALQAWQAGIEEACRRRQWHAFQVAAEEDLADLFLRRLRGRGVLT
ncbi:DUF58 domain-containing protein [Pseudoroseicyclus tamaricis]|uniref:DUF58 domain-containing protein n=1 Tax=Pseudoroseicyclus tamaricis TaxID=2705421 RepID=A0A6B2JRI8_9RHOB|nr:DUF58 domain-containing protein [Pseudoroseicyclus tamaricis]NDV01187.1 DUF58 domain-containing protein [Pseudoroseicyclus tamaricis]